MEDEDKFNLRDRLAVEIFKIFITRSESSLINNFLNYLDSDTDGGIEIRGYADKEVLREVRAAYKMSDLFRKARMEAFK